jgi:hypothetical protein
MKALIQTLKNSRSLHKIILIVILSAIAFWFLSELGIAPISAAFILLFMKGIIRFIYRLVCVLITIAVVISLVGLLIF